MAALLHCFRLSEDDNPPSDDDDSIPAAEIKQREIKISFSNAKKRYTANRLWNLYVNGDPDKDTGKSGTFTAEVRRRLRSLAPSRTSIWYRAVYRVLFAV